MFLADNEAHILVYQGIGIKVLLPGVYGVVAT